MIAFRCACGRSWNGAPSRVDDAPDRPWHPYRYFGDCPDCGGECEQAPWESALMKAHARATGPKTKAGKEISAANLAGHPTPAETKITRFNALKHGRYAEAATYFPAIPGKYPECEGCHYRDGCYHETACMRKVELYMKHHVAFEARDPSLLSGLRATLHANIHAIIDSMLLTILQDGVRQKVPQWYYDKDGIFHLAEYIDANGTSCIVEDIRAHPLLKSLIDLISRNGMALPDSGMTERQTDGVTDDDKDAHGVTEDEMRMWRKQSDEKLAILRQMIDRSSGTINVTPEQPSDDDG